MSTERSLYVMKYIPQVDGIGWTGKKIPQSDTASNDKIFKFLRKNKLTTNRKMDVSAIEEGFMIRSSKGEVLFYLTYT